MFGYVKPELGELKMKEFGRFRAAYCGMCHELKKSYGAAARFILNYDFVFLFMLLSEGKEPPEMKMRRCPASPLRARCVSCRNDALTLASGYSVILAYRKLCDDVRDEKGLKKLKAKLKRALIAQAYKKAVRRYPDFDNAVRDRLAELTELEKNREPSLDRCADKFASLLASASKDRVKEQILYHLGRLVYIADAFNDLEEDLKKGSFNPIAARYGLSQAADKNTAEAVKLTLEASSGVISADAELLPDSYWTGIIKNTADIGIPKMITSVIKGEYVASPFRPLRNVTLKENGDDI